MSVKVTLIGVRCTLNPYVIQHKMYKKYGLSRDIQWQLNLFYRIPGANIGTHPTQDTFAGTDSFSLRNIFHHVHIHRAVLVTKATGNTGVLRRCALYQGNLCLTLHKQGDGAGYLTERSFLPEFEC